MRQAIKEQHVGLDPYFRYRGMSQTRIETLSDTAFALAITLLILSSTVPATFDQLLQSMRNVIPFGLSITLIAIIWYQHYIFFIRYGLQNALIVVLNVLLLFLILVYVYPLKFLFRFLFEFYAALITGDWGIVQRDFGEMLADGSSMRLLMIIYGLGAALIFFTLAGMYRHALAQKEALALDDYEVFATKSSMKMNMLQGLVPVISLLVAITQIFGARYSPIIAGFIYMLYPIVLPLAGRRFSREKNARFQKLMGSPTESDGPDPNDSVN